MTLESDQCSLLPKIQREREASACIMHVGEFYGTTNRAQTNTEEHILGLAFRRVKVGAGLERSFICTFSDILGQAVGMPSSFLGMDAWMTPKLNLTLVRKLRVSLMYLAYFLDIHGRLYNRQLTE